MIPWHENDAFWAALLQHFFTEDRWSAAALEAEKAAALLKLQPGAAVLDLGCGPGRHSLALARLGYQVTGVDRTHLYIEEAQKRAVRDRLALELVHEDMRRFVRPQAFDGAVNLLSSFGYFEDKNEDLLVLRNLRQSLKPGAAVVLDLYSKELVARNFTPSEWTQLPGGTLWLQQREILPDWELIRVRWLFLNGASQQDFTFEHRLYSGVELRGLFLAAGFTKVGLYGSLDAAPYDRNAQRLVVRAA
ncbi:MAG: class I SAM-dependent methyltransferase [Bryobacteraceae bacterium]|nr:class I SAM-dependent methyltransferase [Bryobacteraceae bacterium]